jgi:hypothetical protein
MIHFLLLKQTYNDYRNRLMPRRPEIDHGQQPGAQRILATAQDGTLWLCRQCDDPCNQVFINDPHSVAR